MGKYNRIKESITRVFETAVSQLIAALIFAAIIAYFSRDFIMSVAKYVSSILSHMIQINVPLWMIVLIFVVATMLIIILKYALNKIYDAPLPFASSRSRYGDEIERLLQHNGLNWSIYTPNQRLGRDEYVWVTGPFCPTCNFELKWGNSLKKSWYCSRCNKKFKSHMATE